MSLLATVMRLAVLGRLHDDPGPLDPARVQKILVVRNDNMGDVLCTTPALDALRAAYPRARLAALVCTLTEEAIAGHPALDQLFVYPKAKHRHYGKVESYRRMIRVLGQIRRERFDLVVALRSQFSSSQGWLAFASRGRWRLGPRATGRKEPWGFYYNLPVDPPPRGMHEVERNFHLLKAISVDSQEKRLYLKVPEAAAVLAREFLAGHGLEKPVVVHAARWAYSRERCWPAERYRDLAARLALEPGGVVISAAPGDAEWARELADGITPRVPVFSSPRLKEFAALVARARALITVDGGPMHVAAAVDTPVVVIFSSTPVAEWRPWGVPCQVVGGRGPVEQVGVAEVLAALARLSAGES